MQNYATSRVWNKTLKDSLSNLTVYWPLVGALFQASLQFIAVICNRMLYQQLTSRLLN